MRVHDIMNTDIPVSVHSLLSKQLPGIPTSKAVNFLAFSGRQGSKQLPGIPTSKAVNFLAFSGHQGGKQLPGILTSKAVNFFALFWTPRQ